MSPERVRLDAPPKAARIGAGGIDRTLQRLIGAREQAALRRGIAQGEKQALEGAAGALERAAEELEKAHAAAVQPAVAIALDLARALLRREVAHGNYDLETIVRETLAASGVGRGRCVVHVNPEDATTLEQVRFRAGTTIEADPAVARGDVQVSTPQGLLVREFEQALIALEERLRGDLA